MSTKIGIGIVGTGFGQKVHIPAFQAHPQTEIIAVYHDNLEKAKTIANLHNIPQAVDHINDMIALEKVQGVSISTPPFLHYEMSKAVLQSGKHLLLEKPTTLNAQDAKELYHLSQASSLDQTEKNSKNKGIAIMDFEFRFIPAWQYFSQLLTENYIGKKRLIKIDWLVSSRADETRPWNWYSQQEKGGGVLGAIGSHVFDYIAWLFGDIRRLSAQLITGITQRPDPKEGGILKLVDADDSCTLMLELMDGTPCQICLSSVTYQGRGHWVEVYGSEGTLILGSDNQQDYVHGFRILASQKGQPLTELKIPPEFDFPQVYPDGRIAPLIRVINQWVKAIEQGQNLTPSLREGVYSQLLMDLTYQSHQTGTWINVPNLDKFLGR